MPVLHGALLLGGLAVAGQLAQLAVALRDRRVLAFAASFGVLSGSMAVWSLASPAVFGPALSPLARDPSNALYATLGWHILFPLVMVTGVAAAAIRPVLGPLGDRAWDRIAVAATFAVPAAVAVLGSWALSAVGPLPELTSDGTQYGSLTAAAGPLVLLVDLIALTAIAAGGLARPMAAWMFVSLLASAADSVLTLGAQQRYAAGWYVGRSLAVVSVAVVLAGVAHQLRRLAADLGASRERELGAVAFRHLALHDPVTDLPNWTSLRTRLRARAATVGPASPFALVLLELEGLRDMALGLGRARTDELLRRLALRLRQAPPAGADATEPATARVADVRFAMLVEGAEAEGVAAGRAMLQLAQEPAEVDDLLLVLDGHVGVAVADAADPEELLRRAEVAAAAAADRAEPVLVYAERIERYTERQLALAGEARSGLARAEMELWYQPIVSVSDRGPRAMEALVRWRHPRHGLVQPGEFVPLLERTSAIDDLTAWTLVQAVRDAAVWTGGVPPVTVAVNLPVRSLRPERLLGMLDRALEAGNVTPERLRLEVTESGVMADIDASIRTLDAVRRRGVRVAIDDFGSGQSSLAYLARLPVDEVKIDQAIVRRVSREARAATVVRAATELGHALGMTVVAEGVEDREIWEAVRGMGCDAAQGYFLSLPLAPAAAAAYIGSA